MSESWLLDDFGAGLQQLETVENAQCHKSDVAHLSGKRRAEGIRASGRFSAGVQSTAGSAQKVRRMSTAHPVCASPASSREVP